MFLITSKESRILVMFAYPAFYYSYLSKPIRIVLFLSQRLNTIAGKDFPAKEITLLLYILKGELNG
jgi:hypothetical protein